MKRRFLQSALLLSTLLIFNNCGDDAEKVNPGQVSFSFTSDASLNGKQDAQATPAFVAYTAKKANGTILKGKIELFEFNGSYVTQPQLFFPGQYSLQEYLVLSATNQVLYASPHADSPLADLVTNPLPNLFQILSNQVVVHVVPEVLSVEGHAPEDFGYAVFGFEIVDSFRLITSATIADNNNHPPISYTLEITAKDAPLGNPTWTKSIEITEQRTIYVPARYQHYTFKATRQGYIPHIQYFNRELLSHTAKHVAQLPFEFIPESLDGFTYLERQNGDIKIYLPSKENRCKLYARVDYAEGYKVIGVASDRGPYTKDGFPLTDPEQGICSPESPDYCVSNINLFGNKPYALAENICDRIDLSPDGMIHSLDDMLATSYTITDYIRPNGTSGWSQAYIVLHGANTN